MSEFNKTLVGMLAGAIITILTQSGISAIQSVRWRSDELVYAAPQPICSARRCTLEVIIRNAGNATSEVVTYELPPILGTALVVEYGSRAYKLAKQGDQMVLSFGPLHPQQSAYFSVSYEDKDGSKIQSDRLDDFAIFSANGSARYDDGKTPAERSPYYFAGLFLMGMITGFIAKLTFNRLKQ